MNKTIIAAVAVLLSAGAAQAADLGHSMKDAPLPVVFVPTWEGFYFGGHAGLAAGGTEYPYTRWFYDEEIDEFRDWTHSKSLDFNGALYGAHLGYNFQRGAMVFGVEGTFDGSNLKGDKSDNYHYDYINVDDDAFWGAGENTIERKLNWYTAAVARAGYASGSTLFYGFGGVAWGKVSTTLDHASVDCDDVVGIDCTATAYSLKDSNTHVGWTAGMGIEYALSDRFIARVEYAHVDFGEDEVFHGRSGPGHREHDADMSFDAIKIGASLKLNRRVEVIEPLK